MSLLRKECCGTLTKDTYILIHEITYILGKLKRSLLELKVPSLLTADF